MPEVISVEDVPLLIYRKIPIMNPRPTQFLKDFKEACIGWGGGGGAARWAYNREDLFPEGVGDL